MPMVPENTTSVGPSPLGKPSKGNLLMAAAIQSAGRLSKSAQPNPSSPHPTNKKIKVVK
jgi:hypothetical protein